MTMTRNQRFQRSILLTALCFMLVGKSAFAIEQVDQSNLPTWNGGWTHVNPTAEGRATMWQTFTPSRPNLTAIEIDILTITPGNGDDTLTVEIAKDGDILVTTDCYVEDGFDGLLRFEFPQIVPLVPEQIYELMVRDTGTVRFGWKYATNTYEHGSRYVATQERTGTDWLFQTYSEIEKYGGGTGEPNDPYLIYTAEQMNEIGLHPEDWSKDFKLMADIDLGIYSGEEFNIIGALVTGSRGGVVPVVFSGVFDGNGHIISNFSYTSTNRYDAGLFAYVYGANSEIKNLGLIDPNIDSTAGGITGSLVDWLERGTITNCYVRGGKVSGRSYYDDYEEDYFLGSSFVGGLVGGVSNGTIRDCHVIDCNVLGTSCTGGLVGTSDGIIINCSTSGMVSGFLCIGGLLGQNEGEVIRCYSTGSVSTTGSYSGGLVGISTGTITHSYATGNTSGDKIVGGLIGRNGYMQDWDFVWEYPGYVSNCYSTSRVSGNSLLGGLVGLQLQVGTITSSFWDIETSGQTYSDGGLGKTTTEMQTADTFMEAGWDFVGETENGPNDIWKMWDGYDYPRLAWEPGPNMPLVFVDINDPNFYGQMSRYEITNDQYCNFLNAALASGDITINDTIVEGANGSNSGEDYVGESYYDIDGSGWTGAGATNGGATRIHYNEGAFNVDSGFDNHPVTYVSWYGAMAFCNYYGYYLPTEDQWQAVADYDGTYIYGCGETIDPGIANYRNSEHPDGTTYVGNFGIYGYGMSDMAGNVWEWTSSSLDSSRIFRGGGWYSYDYDCAVLIRGDGIPYANYCDIGFRVCR